MDELGGNERFAEWGKPHAGPPRRGESTWRLLPVTADVADDDDDGGGSATTLPPDFMRPTKK
jgi:hypothetical protein